MILPVRKCYQALKIGIFIVLIVTLLSCFERWRGGKRSVRAQFLDAVEEEYERQILQDEARIIPGLGEGGIAAHLVGEAKRLGEESEKKLAINVYLSDRIAYNRTLKDYRNPACKRVLYDAELPSASVILIFHNEPYSVVVRTIWSVVNSARRSQPWYQRANYVERDTGKTMTLGYPGQDPKSPFVYVKEIILVDDNSTLPELKGKLSYYIRTRLPPDLVRIIRLPDRVGLTQARLAGARFAIGDVLVFLDSHCEGQQDWLRPLLQRIKESSHAVVVPIIDVVEASNFYYSVQDPATFQVGGFTFMGHFTWVDVPEREKKRRGSDISPTWSPTMAGGLFAMSRAYFWELGGYDEQMAGWGGENLEMSFRIWQCGGTLETIPCSRVGHVFRSFHPYGLPAHTDTHGINTARMAEVWMDDFAELFYLHRPDLRRNPKIGDVTHRRVLREKLRCKSFQWYLDTVYREKFVPVRDVYGYGRFRNPATGFCLDTMQREADAPPLGLYPCHAQLQATQYLALSAAGELRDEENCAEVPYTRDKQQRGDGQPVLMVTCHGKKKGQKWSYLPTKQLRHEASRLCLTAGREAGADVLVRRCQLEPEQRWEIDYTEDNSFGADNNVELSEQEQRLQRLRGARNRISRSLLSHESHRRAHHRHRAPRRKNKFVLKLVRAAPNGSEQHLEAELYCAHRRLLPNDSFVRDLVTVLNERDIKVINNGRVFERNRVTDLVNRHDGVSEVKVLEKMDLPVVPAPPALAPPASALQPPKHLPRKRKPIELVQPYSARDGVGPAAPVGLVANDVPALAALAAPAAGPALGPAPPAEKKIIIEDFVEIKPSDATTAPKRLQRKRKRGRSRAGRVRNVVRTAPHTLDKLGPWAAAKRGSVEDSPMLASGELRQRVRDEDDWRAVETRSAYKERTEASPARDADAPADAQGDARADTQTGTKAYLDGVVETENYGDYVVPRPRGRASPPVKLVVRSNLTFNLGDEFFRWKNDDVANLLGELSIPASSRPATRGELRDGEGGDVRAASAGGGGVGEGAAGSQEDDDVLTGRGVLAKVENAAKEGESSGSSDSVSSEK